MTRPIDPDPTPPSDHVTRVLDMIATETRGQVDKRFVVSLVTQCAAQYEGAPVQDFVPVLVFKEVRDHLRQLEPQRAVS